MSKVPSISIEGNIGSGKSSLLAQIIKDDSAFLTEHQITPIYEPVNNWLQALAVLIGAEENPAAVSARHQPISEMVPA